MRAKDFDDKKEHLLSFVLIEFFDYISNYTMWVKTQFHYFVISNAIVLYTPRTQLQLEDCKVAMIKKSRKCQILSTNFLSAN